MKSFTQILKYNFKSLNNDYLFTRYAFILLITVLLGVISVLLGFIYQLSFLFSFPFTLFITYCLIDWEEEHNKNYKKNKGE